DAVWGALQRGHLAQAFEAVFRGDVGGLVGTGAQPVHAGDVDDPAPAAGVHARQVAAHEQERCGDHEALHRVEDVRREFRDRRDVLDTGVVDEDVDVGGQGVDGRGVGQVRGVGVGARLVGDGTGGVGID